jgi:hypothetical protein
MPPNPHLDAIYKHNAAYEHANKHAPTPLRDPEDLVSTLPPPLRVIENTLRRMQDTIRMNAGYFNAGLGDDKSPSVVENVVVRGVDTDAEEDPYYVLQYFDLSQALEGEGREVVAVKEEVKLEFDPPLAYYAPLGLCLDSAEFSCADACGAGSAE